MLHRTFSPLCGSTKTKGEHSDTQEVLTERSVLHRLKIRVYYESDIFFHESTHFKQNKVTEEFRRCVTVSKALKSGMNSDFMALYTNRPNPTAKCGPGSSVGIATD